MSEWYENLKPGDRVFVERGGFYRGSGIDTVERLTPTLIVMKSGLRFKRKNGHEHGGDAWHGSFLRKLTQERMERIEVEKLTHRMRSKVDWSKVPLSTLRDIADKLDELNGEQK